MSRPIHPIVEKLANVRRARGWSQREVCRRAQLGTATISDYEAGRHAPVLAHLVAWADALDYDLVLMPRTPAVPDPRRGGAVHRPHVTLTD